jgi:hypothetical protein
MATLFRLHQDFCRCHCREAGLLLNLLCGGMVFLEFQFAGLAARSNDDKMINALRKSRQKMTETARAKALKLNFGPREKPCWNSRSMPRFDF